MSEIKSYYLQDDRRDNEPLWYVTYDDHLAAIKQAKIDAVREAFIEGVSWGGLCFLDETPEEAADRYIEQLKEQGE